MPGIPPPVRPLSQWSRRELAVDIVLLTVLVVGGVVLFAVGVWALTTRPGMRETAGATAAFAAVIVCWLSVQWVQRIREWQRRNRGE